MLEWRQPMLDVIILLRKTCNLNIMSCLVLDFPFKCFEPWLAKQSFKCDKRKHIAEGTPIYIRRETHEWLSRVKEEKNHGIKMKGLG